MNILKRLASKGLLVLTIVVTWLLDDLIPVLPDSIVLKIAEVMLGATGNGYRAKAFRDFWTAEPDQS